MVAIITGLAIVRAAATAAATATTANYYDGDCRYVLELS